jgi:hypothetical protein
VESLMVSLIVAAVSGLGFLAYKHPKAYEVLSLGVMVVLLLLFAGTGIWDIAVGRAYLGVMEFIPSDKWQQVRSALETVKSPRSWNYVIWGFIIYVQLLRGLPALLERYKEEQPIKEP